MADKPKRIQLSRRKGWRMPEGAVKVDRSGQKRWGRTVATVTAQGRDVGQTLLDADAAKAWPHDSKGRAQQPRPKWQGCR